MIVAYYNRIIPSPFNSDDIIIKVEVRRSKVELDKTLDSVKAYVHDSSAYGCSRFKLNLTKELHCLLVAHLGQDVMHIAGRAIPLHVAQKDSMGDDEWELELVLF
jgi:hypothetical protein